MPDKIYTLHYGDDVIYVGHTNRPKAERQGEHHRAIRNTKDHNEAVYQFIRKVGTDPDMEIIKTIPPDTYMYDYEDFHIMKYIQILVEKILMLVSGFLFLMR